MLNGIHQLIKWAWLRNPARFIAYLLTPWLIAGIGALMGVWG